MGQDRLSDIAEQIDWHLAEAEAGRQVELNLASARALVNQIMAFAAAYAT